MSGHAKYLLPGKKGLLSAILTAGLFIVLQITPFQSVTSAKSYTIEAKAGKHGEIDPSGKVKVERWQSQTFRIIPDVGYAVKNVKVDGEDLGPLESYTFYWVRSNHKIEVSFNRLEFIITASAGPGGEIDPSGEVEVKGGDDRNFKITADNGFEIDDVLVDGISQGPVNEYRFNDVDADHVIEATFGRSIGIREVAIPNQPMKIGDVVPVTLNVEEDNGNTYSLVSGSIGGYPIVDFQRTSSTSYSGSFTVFEGGSSFSASQQIPVTDLVISNNTGQSPPYNEGINQSNDPIDASRPQIESMSVDGGTYKIGDVVILYIEADGAGYSAGLQSSVNGRSLESTSISFSESGDGQYTLSYVVREGDPEVDPQERPLLASVILLEPSGNRGEVYSQLNNASQVTIDTKVPLVTRMDVPSIVVGPGGIVRVNLLADGAGYVAGSGTQVNGIPMSSNRVTFSEGTHGAYSLLYEVGPEDPEVPEGELAVTFIPVDPAGNEGLPYSVLAPNSLEIYTSLPQAILAGPPEICQGEEAVLSVMLEGRKPLDIFLSDGTGTYAFHEVTEEEYQIAVSPENTTSYRIEKVTDVNGIENEGSGEVQVNVNAGADVEILPLASGYSVEADPVLLQASVDGGVFTGPGVISSTSTFYPDVAGISDTPHTIVYTYQNNGGCTSSDSAEVYVMGSEATLLMPVSALCSGQDPVEVEAMNLAGVSGSFSLLDDSGQSVSGLQDHGDNTATLDPSLLEPGDYVVEFLYEDVESMVLRSPFTYENISAPVIMDLAVTMCQSLSPVPLRSDMESVIFEGAGVSGNAQDGYLFDPGQVESGNHTLYATIVSESGCRAVTEQGIEILPVPDVQFGMSTSCIPEGGEMVNFQNLSTGDIEGTTWSWDFGDPASGEENTSTLDHPVHFYDEPGQKMITLTAVTDDGCEADHTIESLIDSKPAADFTWVSDCLPRESGIQFINKTDYGSATADTVLWRFYDEGGALMDETVMPQGTDTLTYTFSGPGTYRVDLYTAVGGGCTDEMTRQMDLQSTYQLDREGYLETFDTSDGGWSVQSDGQNESWVWGTPDFNGHEPEQGNQAWFTRLPVAEEDYQEHSWVMSPCFDLSELERPVIRMNIMKSFVPLLNGAVIQYKGGPDEGWETLGDNTPGIEWYNSSDIILEPGGSTKGWGLETFDPDQEWVNASHDLDNLAGYSHVLFRVAFATNGQEAMGNQGFAFDDVRIAERTKFAVLEHFTEYADEDARAADQIVNAMGKELRRDVIDLHYHMSNNGLDPMNAVNPVPPSTRAFNYGVQEVPYTILDGGEGDGIRFTLNELRGSAPEDRIRLATLEEPAFDIDLEVLWGEEGLEASTGITCLKERYDGFIQLYLVVFETSVTSYSEMPDGNVFRNVVLDMLPSPSGYLVGDRWLQGATAQQTNSWTYQHYVEDREELAVAAFIEDRNSGQILQTTVRYRDPTVDVPEVSTVINQLTVYPNPAGFHVNVSLGAGINDRSRLTILDMGGKAVFDLEVAPGTDMVPLHLDMLDRGLYLVRWTDAGTLLGIAKLVKTQ